MSKRIATKDIMASLTLPHGKHGVSIGGTEQKKERKKKGKGRLY